MSISRRRCLSRLSARATVPASDNSGAATSVAGLQAAIEPGRGRSIGSPTAFGHSRGTLGVPLPTLAIEPPLLVARTAQPRSRTNWWR